MSFANDLRSVSEGAMEQLAGRFPDLPRPLLAAIGAGDLAVERLAALSTSLRASMPAERPDTEDMTEFAAGLQARAKNVASEVSESLERLAGDAPARAQQLISELPGKVSELSGSLNADAIKENLDAYTQFVGNVYQTLAERGEKSWHTLSEPKPGTVVDADADDMSAPRTAGHAPKPTTEVTPKSAPAKAAPEAEATEPTAAKAAPKAEATAKAARATKAEPTPETDAETEPTPETAAETDSAGAEDGAAGTGRR